MNRAKVLLTGLCSLGLLVSVSCKSGGGDGGGKSGGPVNVPMVYHPTNIPGGMMNMPTGNPKVFIAPVEDKRSMTSQIGQNTEENPPVAIVAGTGSPALFVQDALKTELGKVGVSSADSASSADKQLAASISSFESNEGGSYHGQILLMVKVLDKNGTELFNKSVSGESSTWGKSLSPANYQQVLSNSMVDIFTNLMSNSDFVKAISK